MGSSRHSPGEIEAVWLDPSLTRHAAARSLDISVGTLTRRARDLGLPKRKADDEDADRSRPSDDRVRELWLREDLTRAQQARAAGVAISWLTTRARRLGLPRRRAASDRRIPASRIREVWMNSALTTQQAAAAVGLARGSLWRRAKALGLPPRASGNRHAIVGPLAELRFRAMWQAHVHASEIAAHFGIHVMTVSGQARRLGLAPRARPSRPISMERFRSMCREVELRDALAARAEVENAALKRTLRDARCGLVA